jgi:hypothetical protein
MRGKKLIILIWKANSRVWQRTVVVMYRPQARVFEYPVMMPSSAIIQAWEMQLRPETSMLNNSATAYPIGFLYGLTRERLMPGVVSMAWDDSGGRRAGFGGG